MDRFPLLLRGVQTGEMCVSQEGLYRLFVVSCCLPKPELLRAYAIGEQGEMKLGIPAPSGGSFVLHRRIATHDVQFTGALLRGELRPCGAGNDEQWVPAGERLFRTAFLQEQLRGVRGAMTRQSDGVRFLALPFDSRRPFFLTSLFCFARIRQVNGKICAVFAFDADENPIFR